MMCVETPWPPIKGNDILYQNMNAEFIKMKNDLCEIKILETDKILKYDNLLDKDLHFVSDNDLSRLKPKYISKPAISKNIALITSQRSHNSDIENFITENLLVCSELIYRAYENINSIEINPKILSGRLMFTPNDFVQKIDEEIDEKDSDLFKVNLMVIN